MISFEEDILCGLEIGTQAQVVGYIPARVVGYIPGPMTIHICLIGHQESTYYNT